VENYALSSATATLDLKTVTSEEIFCEMSPMPASRTYYFCVNAEVLLFGAKQGHFWFWIIFLCNA